MKWKINSRQEEQDIRVKNQIILNKKINLQGRKVIKIKRTDYLNQTQ